MPIIQPVILSGGAGTRLWPASRSMYPKQLLPLVSGKTMLQETALRLAGRPNTANTMVICNETHRFLVAEQLASLSIESSVILEPEGRNTAPAVALAALLALRDAENGDSPLLLIMPADHVITNPQAFLDAVSEGEGAAAEGKLVTFGVVPTHAHTGYGYIEAEVNNSGPRNIRRFVEKPNKAKASQFVVSGRFFWNAGIFLFRADSFLEELGKHNPEMLRACEASIEKSIVETDFIRPDAEAFKSSPADSIDYAVMEKTTNSAMVPLDAGWSDVGSWSALHDVSEQDANGNHISGDTVTYECKNSYVVAKSRLVAAVGLEDVIVYEDKDAVLVAHKSKSEDVKALVDQLKEKNREEVKLHRQVFRPWGSYDSIDADDGFQAKRLIVNPGAILSLQKHARRAEHWTVVRGTARITLNDDEFDLGVNESTYIAIGDVHRIANVSEEPVHIIEVQCGEYLGEDDIVRLEDNYGRKGTTT